MGKGMTQNISTNVFVEILLRQPEKIETNCNQPVVSPQLGHPFHMTCICWKLTLQIPPTSGNFQLKDLVPIPPQKKKRHNWGTEILSICWSSKWKSKISRFSSDKKGQQLEETLDCLRETRPNILETTILSKMLPSLVNVVQKTCFMFCHREISHLWENMWCVPNNVFSSKSYFFIFLIIIPIQNG